MAKKQTKTQKTRRGPFHGYLASLACLSDADMPQMLPEKLGGRFLKLQETAAKLRDESLRWALKDTTITEAATKLDVVARTVARAIEEDPSLRDLLPARSLRMSAEERAATEAAEEKAAKKAKRGKKPAAEAKEPAPRKARKPRAEKPAAEAKEPAKRRGKKAEKAPPAADSGSAAN